MDEGLVRALMTDPDYAALAPADRAIVTYPLLRGPEFTLQSARTP